MGQSPATLETCRYCLLSFEAYCLARDLALEHLAAEHLARYRQHLLWTPLPGKGSLPAPATVDQHLRMLRTFLRWPPLLSCLTCNPTQSLILPRPLPRSQPLLSRQRLEEVLSHPDPCQPLGQRDRALLRVVCELGFFATTCHQLDLVNLDRCQGRLRGQVMGPHLSEYLQRYVDRSRPAFLTCPQEPALFLTRLGDRISAANVAAVVYTHTQRQAGPRALRNALVKPPPSPDAWPPARNLTQPQGAYGRPVSPFQTPIVRAFPSQLHIGMPTSGIIRRPTLIRLEQRYG